MVQQTANLRFHSLPLISHIWLNLKLATQLQSLAAPSQPSQSWFTFSIQECHKDAVGTSMLVASHNLLSFHQYILVTVSFFIPGLYIPQVLEVQRLFPSLKDVSLILRERKLLRELYYLSCCFLFPAFAGHQLSFNVCIRKSSSFTIHKWTRRPHGCRWFRVLKKR